MSASSQRQKQRQEGKEALHRMLHRIKREKIKVSRRDAGLQRKILDQMQGNFVSNHGMLMLRKR
jgi:hypothetical protein